MALRERIAEVEDTEEAFRARRQLVKLLAQSITVGKRYEEDGGVEVRITYRFGPPSPPPAESRGALSIPSLKNGSRS